MFVFWIIVLLFDFPTWNINTLIEAPSPRTGHGALLQFFVRASESNRETMKSSNLTSSSSLFFRVCHSGCVRSAWASSGCSIIAPPPGQCFSFVQQRLYIWDGCSLWAPPIQLIAELSEHVSDNEATGGKLDDTVASDWPAAVSCWLELTLLSPCSFRRIRGEAKKCRKVYGIEHRDQWCTACRWKKACQRFLDWGDGRRREDWEEEQRLDFTGRCFFFMFLHLEPETVPNPCDEHLAALKQLYTSASLPAERAATKGAFHGFYRSQQLLSSLCKQNTLTLLI